MYTNLCRKVWITLGNLKRDERGVTAIEYALMAAGVAILLAAVLTSGTDWFSEIFGTMKTTVTGSMTDVSNHTPTPPGG